MHHHLLLALLLWSYFSGVVASGMLCATIFTSGRLSVPKRICCGVFFGPPMWTILIVGGLVGGFMSLRHRMRRGRPLMPPESAAPPRG